jgi:toxin CptA
MANVPIKHSFLLATVLAGVHFAAGVTLLPLALSTDLRVVIATVITLSLLRSIWVHAMLRAEHSIIAIAIEDQKSCILHTRGGAMLPARILGSTYVTPVLTVINVKPTGTYFAHHILLLPDSIEPEEFRELRTLLRWARPTHP